MMGSLNVVMNFEFHKMQGITGIPENSWLPKKDFEQSSYVLQY